MAQGLNTGQIFEAQFRASVPKGAWARKLNTPAPPPYEVERVRRVIQELLDKEQDWGPTPSGGKKAPMPFWLVKYFVRTRFTAKMPFDLLITVPAAFRLKQTLPEQRWELGGALAQPGDPELRRDASYVAALENEPQPQIGFALECKGGKGKSFRLDRIKEHQIQGLHDAESKGLVAGLPIWLPEADPDAFFLPVRALTAFILAESRKSLPAAYIAAKGLRISRDPRPRATKPYFRVGEFLRAFGGDVQGN